MEDLRVERIGDGKVSVSFVAMLPTASLEENTKCPFTSWNLKESQRFVGKACDRLLQAISNQDYVTARVASRTASRAEERGKKKVEKLTAQLTAVQAQIGSRGTVPQAEPAVQAPASEIPAAAPRRPAARKSAKGGRR